LKEFHCSSKCRFLYVTVPRSFPLGGPDAQVIRTASTRDARVIQTASTPNIVRVTNELL
jgi:hypothetical protein